MSPKGGERSCGSHIFLRANRNSELGHSLVVQRDIPFHDGCFPKAPNIYDISSYVDMTYAENVWSECHMPHLDLKQARGALHWHHMWEFDPPLQGQISICIYVVLLPYLDDIVVPFFVVVWWKYG